MAKIKDKKNIKTEKSKDSPIRELSKADFSRQTLRSKEELGKTHTKC